MSICHFFLPRSQHLCSPIIFYWTWQLHSQGSQCDIKAGVGAVDNNRTAHMGMRTTPVHACASKHDPAWGTDVIAPCEQGLKRELHT